MPRDLFQEAGIDTATPAGGRDLFAEAGIERSSPASVAPAALTATQRLARGAIDPIEGGAQLLTHALPSGLVNAGNRLNNWLADKTGLVARLPEGGLDEQIRQQEAAYQARRGPDAGIDWLRIGGNVLSPANLALAARAPAAIGALGRTGTAAFTGAGSAGLNPVIGGDDFWAEKAKQATIGAWFGAGTSALGGAIGRVISPEASRNPGVALLRAEGVEPTIGQTLGGMANRVEEKAASVPIMGDAISAARERARQQFNQAAINRTTAPIGVQVKATGQEGVREAGDAIGKAYDSARSAMGQFRLDPQAGQELQRINAMVQMLPQQQQATFRKTVEAIETDVSPNGTIAADVFKRIDSRLGKDAAQFSGSTDPYHQQLGAALAEVQKTISEAGRRANPKADDLFKAADAAYANLVRVEGASKMAVNSGGVFTPGQLQSAVRQADRSVRDRATARGEALMQDLSGAGQGVLGNRVPNSGTADRLWLGAGGLGAGLIHPAIPAGLLAGAAAYTSPVQSLLRGAVSARPQAAEAVRESLLKATPRLLPFGTQVGLGLLGGPYP